MGTKFFSLDCEAEANAMLWGLSSDEKASKLVWQINKLEELNFFRTDDFQLFRNKTKYYFVHYEHIDANYELVYHLYKNQCDGALLIPELKQITYFIHVKFTEDPPQKNIFSVLNKPSEGQLCFPIAPQQLKSKTRDLLTI
jgi:hypothetical protein